MRHAYRVVFASSFRVSPLATLTGRVFGLYPKLQLLPPSNAGILLPTLPSNITVDSTLLDTFKEARIEG